MIDNPKPTETWTEEVARLQREIAERQSRLQFLICGDLRSRVYVPTTIVSFSLGMRTDGLL